MRLTRIIHVREQNCRVSSDGQMLLDVFVKQCAYQPVRASVRFLRCGAATVG
jgi:hypothetical protein